MRLLRIIKDDSHEDYKHNSERAPPYSNVGMKPPSLSLSDSRARIHEGADLYLEKGSRLSLSCSVSDPSAPPSYVYWDA